SHDGLHLAHPHYQRFEDLSLACGLAVADRAQEARGSFKLCRRSKPAILKKQAQRRINALWQRGSRAGGQGKGKLAAGQLVTGSQRGDQAGHVGAGGDRPGRSGQCRPALPRFEPRQGCRHGGRQEVVGTRAVVLASDRYQELPRFGISRRGAEGLEQEGERVVEGAALSAELVDVMSLAQVYVQRDVADVLAALGANRRRTVLPGPTHRVVGWLGG